MKKGQKKRKKRERDQLTLQYKDTWFFKIWQYQTGINKKRVFDISNAFGGLRSIYILSSHAHVNSIFSGESTKKKVLAFKFEGNGRETSLKVFIEFVTILLSLCFIFLTRRHVGSYLPNQGSILHPLHWKVRFSPLDHQRSPGKLL